MVAFALVALVLSIVGWSTHHAHAGASFTSFHTLSFPCDRLTYGTVSSTKNASLLLECVQECTGDLDCASAVFVPRTGLCMVNNSTRNKTLAVRDCGGHSVYVEPIPIPVVAIREPCTTESVCGPVNSACYDAICRCHSGYSYNPSNDSCVTSCVTYGNTFQKEVGALLNGAQYATLHNVEEADCTSQCAADISCISIILYVPGKQGYKTNGSALTLGETYTQAPDYILFQRDCA